MSNPLNPQPQANNPAVQASSDPDFHCVLIVGPGRSGTTWLGQILNTYEHCSYKYEPFLPAKQSPYRQWLQALPAGQADQLRRQFWCLCSNCYHEVDFPANTVGKSFRKQNLWLLRLLHQGGKQLALLKQLYEWYGRTELSRQTPILIKDVNFPIDLLPRLCEVLRPHLIAMIRSPFGNIASYLNGVEQGFFQVTREEKISQLRQVMDAPSGQFLSPYRERLPELSLAQLETVRWRFQVEPLVEFAKTYEPGRVVVYEDLCADPHSKADEIFAFLGWPLSANTYDFIDQSISGERSFLRPSKAYYSTYRDPRQSASKWRTQLSPQQQAGIAAIFQDSPLKSLWPDLLT